MHVLIPSALHSYTKRSMVTAHGQTVAELLADLDRQFPGIRFRVVNEQDQFRPHMRCFINNEQVFDIQHKLQANDDVCLVQALSGG